MCLLFAARHVKPTVLRVIPGNSISEEGAKALGPHLAKLTGLSSLDLSSAFLRGNGDRVNVVVA